MNSIKENNNLIAEFMGGILIGSQYGFKIIPSQYENIISDNYNDIVFVNKDNLQYHISWDWLEPVIKKIEKSGYLFYFTRFCDSEDYFCQLNKINFKDFDGVKDKDGDYKYICYNKSDNKIYAVWLSIVEFIIKYNKK